MDGKGRESSRAGDASELEVLRRRIETLEQEKKDLEAFNHAAAHDLNAPLTRIEGYSEMLIDELSRNHLEHEIIYVQRVSNAARQAKRLIHELLDLSRSSNSRAERQKVDLSEMAAEMLREYSRSDPHRKTRFVVCPGVTVMANAVLMRILMINLLGNAWKFTQKSPVSNIEFGMKKGEDGPVYYVADNGIGFERDKAEVIFSAFCRLSGSSEFEGSGVGLATSKRIVLRHGGRIWACGRPGLGAVFYFTLPEN